MIRRRKEINICHDCLQLIEFCTAYSLRRVFQISGPPTAVP